MDSSLSESESSSNDEFLSHESIKSRTTGLPEIYRESQVLESDTQGSQVLDIPSSDDEEVLAIVNNDVSEDMADRAITKSIPKKELSNSSIESVVSNLLAQSTSNHECVICLGDDSEQPLIQNKLCDCKFVYHSKCYYDWIKSSRKNTCILCKTPVIRSDVIITNFRLLDILGNNIQISRRQLNEGYLDIIEIPENERNSCYNKCGNFLYNHVNLDIKYLLYCVGAIFGTLVCMIIIYLKKHS